MEAETTTPNSIVFIGDDREEDDEVGEEQWKAKRDEKKGQIKMNGMMEAEEEGNKPPEMMMNSRNKKRWKNSTETTMIPSSTISSHNEEDQNNNNKIGEEEKADEAKAATTTILVIEEENVDTDSGKNVVEETKKGEENCGEILAIKNNNKIAVMAELRRAVELEETEMLMMNGNGGQEGGGGGVRKSINEIKRSANMKKRMEARQQHQQNKMPIPALQREWLEQLRNSGGELETMTVLYAKSVLNNESISRNGARKWQQHLDRVPICPHQPVASQQCQHKQLAMPSISHQNCPPSLTLGFENVAPESSNGGQQFGRLRVTRIDKTDNNEQHYEEGCEKWNNKINGNDNGELFRSTVCLFDGGGGGESIANNSDFPLAHSLVMNRSSRVEIDARKWPTKSSNGTLNKFAQSLPNGHGLAQRLATMNDGIDEWEEEEDWQNGRQRRDEFGEIGNGNKITGGEMAIYRPAIRYRRKCQQNGNNNGREHHRRKAGAGGNYSQFCHSNPNFPPFRHSIRVNIEGNNCGEHSHQNDLKNDITAPIYGHHFCSSNPNLVHPTSSLIHHSSYLPPPSSPPPFPPASSSDSGQGSAGTSPPFCAANAKSAQMLIGGQRRGAILMMENSSSSLADDDSSAEEEYFDDDTLGGGPSKIASRRRQQWPMGNGNGTGNFGGIRQQPPPLPSYARTASTIDQALRLSSTIFAHFSFANPTMAKSSMDGISAKKLAETCATFIQLVQTSPCAKQMPKANIELVRRAIHDLERTAAKKDANRKEADENDGHNWDDDYLAVCGRQMAEGCMLQFCRVLCQYLGQCSPEDRLLPIALEQFIHLLLFGDEFCVDAIRLDAVDNLLAIGQCWPKNGQICCPPSTLKLILRALAVLCGTAKGCLQLLSMGGFDFVMECLMMMEDGDTKKHSPQSDESSMMAVAYEAAGCLAQLSNPSHPFVRPPRPAGPFIQRLLQLADAALQPESLLLCMAALANLTAQSPAALCEQLYVNNAVLRLIRAAQLSTKANAQNPFVQEQLVTILTRMANRGHQLALIAQGAIPALCKMLGPIKATGRMADLERRIGYKAAICLGFLASNGVGLKALNEQKVYPVLLEIGRNENRQRSMTPVQLICASIRQKLESTFQPQLETAV